MVDVQAVSGFIAVAATAGLNGIREAIDPDCWTCILLMSGLGHQARQTPSGNPLSPGRDSVLRHRSVRGGGA